MHCPRAPTLEPSKEGHRPKNRHPQRKGKVVSCRPRASRSSSQGRGVGSALPGLRLLALPVGRSGWPVLIPCRSWLFPWFFLGWLTRAPSKALALSGTPLRTTLWSFTCLLYFACLGLRVKRLAVMDYDRSRRPSRCDHVSCSRLFTDGCEPGAPFSELRRFSLHHLVCG